MRRALHRLRMHYWNLRGWWNPEFWNDPDADFPGTGFE